MGAKTGFVHLEDAHARLLASISAIDFKTTGQTTLYTVPAGRTLYVIDVLLVVDAVVGGVSGPTVRIGKSALYTEFIAAVASGVLAAGSYATLGVFHGAVASQSFTAGDVVKLDVTVGAVATSMSGSVYLFGWLI